MEAVKLYKYLDFTGGLMMLHYSNLQFTNATQLNDPFDCHPSLIDFSNVPKEACGGWTPEIIEELRRDPFRRTREEMCIRDSHQTALRQIFRQRSENIFTNFSTTVY